MAYHQSSSFIILRYCLVLLCISMIIIQVNKINKSFWIGYFVFVQVSEALNDDLSSSSIEDNTEQQIERRSSKKVAQMLQRILQRGEMQVEPYRIHKFLGRLNRRKTTDHVKDLNIH